MSFFVALNVLCSLLATFLPLLSIILVIFLPLTSTVVEVLCKDRWFPIYAFATVGLSIVVSLSSIDFTIFYVVPSIFTGYIFGLFSKRNFPSMFAIFFASIIQTLLSFAFIPLLELITGTNLIDFFAKILGIYNRFWYDTLILLMFFIFSLIQVILSFIVVKNELQKFGQETNWRFDEINFANYSIIGCAILSAICSFFYLPLSYLFFSFAYYFVTFVIASQIKTINKKLLIGDVIIFFLGILAYASFNKYIPVGLDFSLLIIPASLISILSICDSFLKKSQQ